jgi:hypothetical protein
MCHSLADIIAAVPYVAVAVAKFCSLLCGFSIVKPLLYIMPETTPGVPLPVEGIH